METVEGKCKAEYILSWIAVILYLFFVSGYFTFEIFNSNPLFTALLKLFRYSNVHLYTAVVFAVFFFLTRKGYLISKMIWLGTLVFFIFLSSEVITQTQRSIFLPSYIYTAVLVFVIVLLLFTFFLVMEDKDIKGISDKVFKSPLYKVVALYFIIIGIVNLIFISEFLLFDVRIYYQKAHNPITGILRHLLPKVFFVYIYIYIFYLNIRKNIMGYILSIIFLSFNTLMALYFFKPGLFIQLNSIISSFLYNIPSFMYRFSLYVKCIYLFTLFYHFFLIFPGFVLLILFSIKLKES